MTLELFLDLAGFYLGCFASVVGPAVYAVTAKWWRNPFGRYWMVQSVVITLLYLKSLVFLLTGHLNLNWANAIANVAAGLLMSYQAFVFVRLTWKLKKAIHG